MKRLILLSAATAALSFAATFTGVITDNMCANPDHKDMKMGADAKCVTECVKGMNAKYALYDASKKTSYVLSDQTAPAQFAAKKVTVTGTLDEKTKTIKVDSIAPVK